MKFVFPQNYNFSAKIFGIIDYTSAILDLIWGVLVYLIVNFLFYSWTLKIFIMLILIFPVLIFSIVGINGENIIYVMTYIIKYLIKQKIYLYDKIL